MTLEKLMQRIKEEADREIGEIIARAEEEAKKIIEEEEKKGMEEAEKIKANAIKEAEKIKEKILSNARRKARVHETSAKEEVINECMKKVVEKLKKMDGKKYSNFVEKNLEIALKEIKDGYILFTRDEDVKIAKKFGIETKEKIDGIGGVILRSKDGKKEIDLTFNFLIEKNREEMRIKIAKKLFGENDF
ncbi:MAG: V-type ATP synthase subunit E [Candidatus Thermoplasmatota archaeon]